MVLASWKQIAEYLGCSVRTVQRWEAELGMPVHRPYGKPHSAVIALPEDLDRWVAQAPLRVRPGNQEKVPATSETRDSVSPGMSSLVGRNGNHSKRRYAGERRSRQINRNAAG